jgi:hypothetical protein
MGAWGTWNVVWETFTQESVSFGKLGADGSTFRYTIRALGNLHNRLHPNQLTLPLTLARNSHFNVTFVLISTKCHDLLSLFSGIINLQVIQSDFENLIMYTIELRISEPNLLDLYISGYNSSKITIRHSVIFFRLDTPRELFWLPT